MGMDRVFTFTDKREPTGHWVVIAIGEPDPEQRHIGILHRQRNAGLQFLHLAWHCCLRNDDARPAYLTRIIHVGCVEYGFLRCGVFRKPVVVKQSVLPTLSNCRT